MKPWNYYSESDIPYSGINDTPSEPHCHLTLNDLPDLIKRATEKNKARIADLKKREEQFWLDCRDHLEYDGWLDIDGVKLLEKKAWEQSHSEGFMEVFDTLSELIDFSKNLISRLKKPIQTV